QRHSIYSLAQFYGLQLRIPSSAKIYSLGDSEECERKEFTDIVSNSAILEVFNNSLVAYEKTRNEINRLWQPINCHKSLMEQNTLSQKFQTSATTSEGPSLQKLVCKSLEGEIRQQRLPARVRKGFIE